ncbi:MAG: hypothetical protein JST92_18150 [Deltaproteobacteria bacterium]|nr:hypothetical protein [Deltaproteobacteria bacterium]
MGARGWMLITFGALLVAASSSTPPRPNPPTAAAADLVLSPASQSIDDFCREWRRARKMARACQAPPDTMQAVSFLEGMLGAAKAEQQRKLGKEVGDARAYSIGFQDALDVTEANCKKHREALLPILEAFAATMAKKDPLPLWRAPAVACPAGVPCP